MPRWLLQFKKTVIFMGLAVREPYILHIWITKAQIMLHIRAVWSVSFVWRVCMYVCMYVHVCVCVHAYVCVRVGTFLISNF